MDLRKRVVFGNEMNKKKYFRRRKKRHYQMRLFTKPFFINMEGSGNVNKRKQGKTRSKTEIKKREEDI